MNRMKRLTLILAVAFALPAFAEAPPKPEKAVVCAACHGETGVSAQPIYPNLAGQYRNYLEHSLKEYRSGARKNAIMSAQSATLTDDDIKALAAYFAAQPGPLYTPRLGK